MSDVNKLVYYFLEVDEETQVAANKFSKDSDKHDLNPEGTKIYNDTVNKIIDPRSRSSTQPSPGELNPKIKEEENQKALQTQEAGKQKLDFRKQNEQLLKFKGIDIFGNIQSDQTLSNVKNKIVDFSKSVNAKQQLDDIISSIKQQNNQTTPPFKKK